jgi:hypothetical protein
MALELIGRVGQSVPVLKDKVAQASPWYIVPAVRKHAAAQGSSTESLVTAVLNIEQIGTTSRSILQIPQLTKSEPAFFTESMFPIARN